MTMKNKKATHQFYRLSNQEKEYFGVSKIGLCTSSAIWKQRIDDKKIETHKDIMFNKKVKDKITRSFDACKSMGLDVWDAVQNEEEIVIGLNVDGKSILLHGVVSEQNMGLTKEVMEVA